MKCPLHLLHLEGDPNEAALIQSALKPEGLNCASICSKRGFFSISRGSSQARSPIRLSSRHLIRKSPIHQRREILDELNIFRQRIGGNGSTFLIQCATTFGAYLSATHETA
jgi:hypothetical protein